MKEERFTIPNPNGAGYRIPACRGGVSEQNGSRTSQLYMEALLIGWVLMKTSEVLKN